MIDSCETVRKLNYYILCRLCRVTCIHGIKLTVINTLFPVILRLRMRASTSGCKRVDRRSGQVRNFLFHDVCVPAAHVHRNLPDVHPVPARGGSYTQVRARYS